MPSVPGRGLERLLGGDIRRRPEGPRRAQSNALASALDVQQALGNRAATRLLSRSPQDGAPSSGAALGPGDHVWEWNGNISTAKSIPRAEWFEGSTGPTDYLGHGKEIYQYVIYPDHVKRGQPHMRGGKGTFAWLNNNPGNLTAGGKQLGEYPGKRNWHNFLIFPTMEAGRQAIPRFLKANGYGPLSLRAAFKKYAPSGDGGNNPERYAQSVVDALGGSVTLESTIDSLTDDQLMEVAKAIEKMEASVAGDTFSRSDTRLPPALRERLGGGGPAPAPPSPDAEPSDGSVVTLPEVTIEGTPDPTPADDSVITIPEVTVEG